MRFSHVIATIIVLLVVAIYALATVEPITRFGIQRPLEIPRDGAQP